MLTEDLPFNSCEQSYEVIIFVPRKPSYTIPREQVQHNAEFRQKQLIGHMGLDFRNPNNPENTKFQVSTWQRNLHVLVSSTIKS